MQYLGFLFEDCSEIKQSCLVLLTFSHHLLPIQPVAAGSTNLRPKIFSVPVVPPTVSLTGKAPRDANVKMGTTELLRTLPMSHARVSSCQKKNMAFTSFPFVCNTQWWINK